MYRIFKKPFISKCNVLRTARVDSIGVHPRCSFSALSSPTLRVGNDSAVTRIASTLDEELKLQTEANFENILQHLDALKAARVLLPRFYLQKSIDIFAKANKIGLIDRVLTLAKANLEELEQSSDSIQKTLTGSQSLSAIHSNLVAYTIRSLIRSRKSNDALELWTKTIRNNNADVNISIEKVFHSIIRGQQATLSLRDARKFHQSINGLPLADSCGYYCDLLKRWELHALHMIRSKGKKEVAGLYLDVLDAWWQDAQLATNEVNTMQKMQLSMQRLRCDIAGYAVVGQMDAASSSQVTSTLEQFLQQILPGFNSLLVMPQTDINLKDENSIDQMVEYLRERQHTVREALVALSANGKSVECLRMLKTYVAAVKSMPTQLSTWKDPKQKSTSQTPSSSIHSSISSSISSNSGIHSQSADQYFTAQKELLKGQDNEVDTKSQQRLVLGSSVGAGLYFSTSTKGSTKYANENEFVSSLFVDILRMSYKNGVTQLGASVNHIQQVDALADQLLALSTAEDIPLSREFYAAWVSSLVPMFNSRVLHRPKTGVDSTPSTDNSKSLPTYLQVEAKIRRVLNQLNEEMRDDPLINDAVVTALCRCEHPAAIKKALHYASDLVATNRDNKSKNNISNVTLETWAALLYASSHWNEAHSHTKLVTAVENIVVPGYANSRHNGNYQMGLLYANARVGNGLTSLQILRNIRKHHGKVDYQTYIWVINSIYYSRSHTESEKKIILSPTLTSNWLLQAIHQDELMINGSTVTSLLKLFGRAANESRANEEIDKKWSFEADEFVNTMISASNYGSPVTPTTEMIIGLIKVCCIEGNIKQANRYLNEDYLKKRFNLQLTAEMFEPVVFHFARKRGHLVSAEDVITAMTNNGLVPTTSIIDAYFEGMLEFASSPDLAFDADIIDWIQLMFTQHNARPSPSSLIRLLDHYLLNKDEYEAKRVVLLIDQLFSEQERSTAVTIDLAKPATRTSKTTKTSDGTAPTAASSGLRIVDAHVTVPMYQSRLKSGFMPTTMEAPENVPSVHRRALSVEYLRSKFEKAGVSVDF